MSYHEYNLYGDDQIDVDYHESDLTGASLPVVDINPTREELKKEGWTNRSQNSVIVDQGLSQSVRNKLNNLYSSNLKQVGFIPASQKKDAITELSSYFNESQLDCIRSNMENHYVPGNPGGDVWMPPKRMFPACRQPIKETFVGCPCEKTKNCDSWWGGDFMSWGQHSSMVLQFLLLVIFVVMVMQYNLLCSMEQTIRMHQMIATHQVKS